jgi:hypothetical protein
MHASIIRNSKPTQKPFFILFFSHATHPKSGIGQQKEHLFFEFIVPLLPVRQWQSLRQQGSFAVYSWGIFHSPNPFGCSFFVKQKPNPQSQRFLLLYKKTSRNFYPLNEMNCTFFSNEIAVRTENSKPCGALFN